MLPSLVRGPGRRGDGRGPRLGPLSPLCILLLAGLAGPGCEGTELVGGGLLEVTPAEVDFGAVPFGEARTVELRLRNTSNAAPIRLDEVALAEGSAPVFSLGEVPAELGPGADATVLLRYDPDDAAPDAATVLIRSNALERPVRRIPVRSGQTFPRVAVRPERLDLGSILAGGSAEARIQILSVGDAPLHVRRLALRSAGFPGEPCTSDTQCRDARCLEATSGRICAPECDAGCAAGYACRMAADGTAACLEAAGTLPPRSARGFTIAHPELDAPPAIPPGGTLDLAVTYAPSADDRGGAQLLIETDDAQDPVRVVPLLGRPEDLPPTADAQLAATPPDPVLPGTRIELTGEGSSDPEGSALTYGWRFLRRPEGSRAAFEAPQAALTAFSVDRPGVYVATLEVLDGSGQASTNDARVTVTAEAGPSFEVELTWDRPGTDLDLHVVAPGGSVGSVADCFFDNPDPDWAPPGPDGDPSFVSGPARETVSVTDATSGAFSLAVRVVAASPAGPTAAHLRLRLNGVEVANYAATLAPSHEAWDVATLSWPTGRIADLDTIR